MLGKLLIQYNILRLFAFNETLINRRRSFCHGDCPKNISLFPDTKKNRNQQLIFSARELMQGKCTTQRRIENSNFLDARVEEARDCFAR